MVRNTGKVVVERSSGPNRVHHAHPDTDEASLCGAVRPDNGPPGFTAWPEDVPASIAWCSACEYLTEGDVGAAPLGEDEDWSECPVCGAVPSPASGRSPIWNQHLPDCPALDEG